MKFEKTNCVSNYSADSILKLPEVIATTRLSRATIYRLKQHGKLSPIKLGERASGWRLSDIEAYLSSINKAEVTL